MSQRFVNTLTAIIVILLIVFMGIFMMSQQSINQAQAETEELVSLDYPVDRTNKFYWLTTPAETFFAIDFTDEAGDDRYAIVAQEGGDIFYFNHNELITEEDAKGLTLNYAETKEIIQARLGMYNGKPVWEVTFTDEADGMNYYYIDAQTGEWIQTIANL